QHHIPISICTKDTIMSATASHPTSVRPRRFPVWSSFVLAAVILLGNLPGIAAPLPMSLSPLPVAAQGVPCVDNSHGSYTSRTCITLPADGSTVSGDVPTEVSITAVSGTLPSINQVYFYLTPVSTTNSIKIA